MKSISKNWLLSVGLVLVCLPGSGWQALVAGAGLSPKGTSAAPPVPGSSSSHSDPLTAEQAHRRWDLDELQFSPDGRRLAFTVRGPREGIKLDTDLWILHLETSELKQLTFSAGRDHHPRWSPDGGGLAFLSNRSDKSQIYLLPMDGGESRALTRSETPVGYFEWSPDGKSIAYEAAEPQTADEKKGMEASGPVRVVATSFYDDAKNSQVWTLDVASGETRQLTPGDWRLAHSYWAANFVWAPGSDRLFVSGTREPVPEKLDNRIYTLRISDGHMEEFARPSGGYGRLSISPDRKTLAYLGPRQDAFEYDDLFFLPVSGGLPQNLTGQKINRRISAYNWLQDGSLVVLVADGFGTSLYRCRLDGSVDKIGPFTVPPSGHYSYSQAFAATSDVLAFIGESTSLAPELWISGDFATARKVSNFNREWDGVPVAPLEVFRYPSFDGTNVEAGLLKPLGYREGQKVPLVVLVHGGPSSKFSDLFNVWSQMLAARGFAVLMPNIRGSTGYGYEFLTMNRYDWGGGDFKDVMAGVDAVIDRGIADPERLGIGGWSYGGYMTAWAVTQTDRFKAAVAGAPITDLASEYGTEDRWVHFYDTWYLGTPYQNAELFRERSPVTYVERVKTPLLLMVGERDDNTPIGQCLQFFRGVKMHDGPAELVIYPGAGHFPSNEKQRLEVHRRFVDWFVRHLPTAE